MDWELRARSAAAKKVTIGIEGQFTQEIEAARVNLGINYAYDEEHFPGLTIEDVARLESHPQLTAQPSSEFFTQREAAHLRFHRWRYTDELTRRSHVRSSDPRPDGSRGFHPS